MADEDDSAANFQQELEDIRQIDKILESEDDDYSGSDLEIEERRETDDDLSGVPSIRPEQFSPKPLSTISSSLGDVPGSLAGLEIESDSDVDVSKEQLLLLNQQYQEYVATNLQRVRKALEKNRELQHSKLNTKKKDSCALVYNRFTAPYFKDEDRLNPPENDDTRAIRQMGYPLPTNPGCPRPWSKADLENLKEGVKADGLERIMAPLLNQREVYEKRLKKATDDADRAARKEFIGRIREIDKELFNLKKLPEADVLGVPDREVDWHKVANRHLDGTRTMWECQMKWQNDAHPSIKHDWTSEDDQKLEEIAATHKHTDWNAVARGMGSGYTAYECLQRYQQKVNYGLYKRQYSPEEDNLITELVNKFRVGKFVPWMKVAYFLQDRKPCQVAWRWENKLDPTLKTGKWSTEEDQLLKKTIEKQKDDVVWVRVALEIEGRTALQCRNRWKNCLSPDIRRGRFSALEDLILLEAVQKCGIGHWSKVSTLLEKDKRFTPGRSHGMFYHRYRYLANHQITKERAKFATIKRQEKQKLLDKEMASITGSGRMSLIGFSEGRTFEQYLDKLTMTKFLEGMLSETKKKVAILADNAKTHNISEITGALYRCYEYKPTSPEKDETNSDDVVQVLESSERAVPLKFTRPHRSALNYLKEDPLKWKPDREDVTLMMQLTKAVFPGTTLKPNAFFERNTRVTRARSRCGVVMSELNKNKPVTWATAMSILMTTVRVDFHVCRGILYRDARLPPMNFLGDDELLEEASRKAKKLRRVAVAVGGARNNRPLKLMLNNPDYPGVGEMVTGSIIGHLPGMKKEPQPVGGQPSATPAINQALYVVKTEDGRFLLVSALGGGPTSQLAGPPNSVQPGPPGVTTEGTTVDSRAPSVASDKASEDNIVVTAELVEDEPEGSVKKTRKENEKGRRRGKRKRKVPTRFGSPQQLDESDSDGDFSPNDNDVDWNETSAVDLPRETTVVSNANNNVSAASLPATIGKVNTLPGLPESIAQHTTPLITTGIPTFPRVGSGMIFKPQRKPKAQKKVPQLVEGDNPKIVVGVTPPNGFQPLSAFKPLDHQAMSEKSCGKQQGNINVIVSGVPEDNLDSGRVRGDSECSGGNVDSDKETDAGVRLQGSEKERENVGAGLEGSVIRESDVSQDDQAISLLMSCTGGMYIDEEEDTRLPPNRDNAKGGMDDATTCSDGVHCGTDDENEDIDESAPICGKETRPPQNNNKADGTGGTFHDSTNGGHEEDNGSGKESQFLSKAPQNGVVPGDFVNHHSMDVTSGAAGKVVKDKGGQNGRAPCSDGVHCGTDDEEETMGSQYKVGVTKKTKQPGAGKVIATPNVDTPNISMKRNSRKRKGGKTKAVPEKREKSMPVRATPRRKVVPKTASVVNVLLDDSSGTESDVSKSSKVSSSATESTSSVLQVPLTSDPKAINSQHQLLAGSVPSVMGGTHSATISTSTNLQMPVTSAPQTINSQQQLVAGSTPSVMGGTPSSSTTTSTVLQVPVASTPQTVNSQHQLFAGSTPSVMGGTPSSTTTTSTVLQVPVASNPQTVNSQHQLVAGSTPSVMGGTPSSTTTTSSVLQMPVASTPHTINSQHQLVAGSTPSVMGATPSSTTTTSTVLQVPVASTPQTINSHLPQLIAGSTPSLMGDTPMAPGLTQPPQAQTAHGVGHPGSINFSSGVPNLKVVLGPDGTFMGFLMDQPAQTNQPTIQQNPTLQPSVVMQPPVSSPQLQDCRLQQVVQQSSITQQDVVTQPPVPSVVALPGVTQQVRPSVRPSPQDCQSDHVIQQSSAVQPGMTVQAPQVSVVTLPGATQQVSASPQLQADPANKIVRDSVTTGGDTPPDLSSKDTGSVQAGQPASGVIVSNPAQQQSTVSLCGTNPVAQASANSLVNPALNPLMTLNNPQQVTIILNAAGQPVGSVVTPGLAGQLNLPIPNPLTSSKTIQSTIETVANEGVRTPVPVALVSTNGNQSMSSMNVLTKVPPSTPLSSNKQLETGQSPSTPKSKPAMNLVAPSPLKSLLASKRSSSVKSHTVKDMLRSRRMKQQPEWVPSMPGMIPISNSGLPLSNEIMSTISEMSRQISLPRETALQTPQREPTAAPLDNVALLRGLQSYQALPNSTDAMVLSSYNKVSTTEAKTTMLPSLSKSPQSRSGEERAVVIPEISRQFSAPQPVVVETPQRVTVPEVNQSTPEPMDTETPEGMPIDTNLPSHGVTPTLGTIDKAVLESDIPSQLQHDNSCISGNSQIGNIGNVGYDSAGKNLGSAPPIVDTDNFEPDNFDEAGARFDDVPQRGPSLASSGPETVASKLKSSYKSKKPLLPELMKEDRYTVDLEKLREFSLSILGIRYGQRGMGLLPPNLATLFSFKHLLIRKDTLEESAEMFSITKGQLNAITGTIGLYTAYKERAQEQARVHKKEFISQIRKLPEYELFKERFTFLYLWPAFLSLLQPHPKKTRKLLTVPRRKRKGSVHTPGQAEGDPTERGTEMDTLEESAEDEGSAEELLEVSVSAEDVLGAENNPEVAERVAKGAKKKVLRMRGPVSTKAKRPLKVRIPAQPIRRGTRKTPLRKFSDLEKANTSKTANVEK